jgi:hypothetical protein
LNAYEFITNGGYTSSLTIQIKVSAFLAVPGNAIIKKQFKEFWAQGRAWNWMGRAGPGLL